MAESYRENYIYTGDDFSFYIAKVFCSWDYGITDEESATLKQKSISNDLKVFVHFLMYFPFSLFPSNNNDSFIYKTDANNYKANKRLKIKISTALQIDTYYLYVFEKVFTCVILLFILLFHVIQEVIAEHQFNVERSTQELCCLVLIRCLTNLIVFGLIGGGCFLIYYTATMSFEVIQIHYLL